MRTLLKHLRQQQDEFRKGVDGRINAGTK